MATIKDVAKKANLSVTTVSRYLNNHPYITEEKRQLIKDAMQALNYVPSSIATQLRSRKSTMIGVLVARITNPFFSYLIDAIERHAKAQGYRVLVMQTYEDKRVQDEMLALLAQNTISGLIMCSIEGERNQLAEKIANSNVVLCNESLASTNVPQIVTDQRLATYQAIRYLVGKGYHNIAYCTGGSLTAQGHGDERTSGFEQALIEFGLSFKKRWLFKNVHSIADGKNIARQLLDLAPALRPNAIFANSDEVASGILSVMQQHTIAVPESLAIIGFDDQPLAALLPVPLTTIAQPIEALGRESVNQLIALIEHRNYLSDHTDLQLKLIVRQSA